MQRRTDHISSKYRKFKRPLPSYSGTQASAIEHVQGSIEASWRTDGTIRRSGLGSKGRDLDRLVSSPKAVPVGLRVKARYFEVGKESEFTSVALDQWAYWHEVQLVQRDRRPRRITRISSHLMPACGRNVSMPIGLNRSRRHEGKSGHGSINITRNILTVR